jgi:hypothetical protein
MTGGLPSEADLSQPHPKTKAEYGNILQTRPLLPLSSVLQFPTRLNGIFL